MPPVRTVATCSDCVVPPARSLLVAPLVLVAAACGGSGSDAAEPASTDAPIAATAAPAGVIDLLPSEFYGDQATLLMSYSAGQVVSDGVVFVPDSATVQGWVLLPSGAPVEVATPHGRAHRKSTRARAVARARAR